MYLIPLLLIPTVVKADLFDFFQHQFRNPGQPQPPSAEEIEAQVLNKECSKYLCPDTQACVSSPNECPCPFPSSQLRCVLPNGNYLCISKPAGPISDKYEDSETNWKIDNGDDVRDCGWVNRALKGLV